MRKDSMEEDIQILAYKFSENIIEIIDNIERNKFNMDKLNENERARLKIYGEYIDLNETYESVKNCLIYINSFPFYPRVAKVDYLKFIYTAYLNEIYILQTRILKLTKTIKRSLKEYIEEKNLRIDLDVIDKSTNNAIDRFKRIIEIRGSHVHVKRYTTKNIDIVESYEFISGFKGTDNYKIAFKNEIKELKKQYVKKIKHNQEQIEKILKSYLQDINDFLFKKQYIKKVKNYQGGRKKL